MSYTTGSAINLSALRSAIFSACASAGWTFNTPVLSRSGIAMKIDEVTVSSFSGLRFTAGTGASGSALTNASPSYVEMGTTAPLTLTFPVTYHIFTFTAPDEVYVVLNYDVDRYQWAAWGRSTISLPGAGVWFGACIGGALGGSATSYMLVPTGEIASGGYICPALFIRSWFMASNTVNVLEGIVHHGLDGIGWTTGAVGAPGASASPAANPLISILPNTWNSEAVLLPIQALVRRPSNMSSVVASLANARYTRIDNYNPGDILTIGDQEWMVLPWLRKNSAARQGMISATSTNLHSGTLGWAIRYDGA